MTEAAPPIPARILLVDDQPGKLLSYEIILQDLGEPLLKASSAREALEILLKTDVAVILIDVCMPELDGFELARMIRDHPRFGETAIIFISAIHLSEIDSLKGYEMGAVDYVPVPVVPGVLRAKVRVFVDLYRKTRALAELNGALELRVAERTAALEAAIARQQLLAREVDHRARNALAVVQSIVMLTPAAPKDEFVRSVNGRIGAMARAHTLLSESRWAGAELRRLVDEELAAYRDATRVASNGPNVLILPTVAQTLALTLHELATNAAKYGALSGAGERLDVSWSIEGEELVLTWSECVRGGLDTPTHMGFGTRVIDTSIRSQLGGRIERTWRADGLRCVLRLPAAYFAPTASPDVTERRRADEARPAPVPTPLASARVLVVEDEPLVALMMAQSLTEAGAEVAGPFNSLRDAAKALDQRLDAAVLDVNVGGEPVHAFATLLADRGVPLLFITGYQADSLGGAFADAPVLTKPIEAAEAVERLVRLLDARPAAAQALTA